MSITTVAAIVNGLTQNQSLASNTLAASAITASTTIMATGDISAANFSGSSSGTNTGDQTITLTGDVSGSGTGSFAATIASGVVSLSKMSNLAANSIIGNNTGSSATPLALTEAEVTAMLSLFSSSLQGLVPASGGGTANFLRADGTWATPAGTAYTFADSLVNTSGTVTLVNDSASPTASQYYGTDSGSTLGYYDLPASGIDQLTGDVTAGPGSGSQAATLATVNSDTGSFGSSTAIPSFTVNGKGLITAASTNVVVAPAGTLTGSTLASGVTASSLTSLGTQAQALNMGSNQINDLANGVVSTDAATYGQLLAIAAGLSFKNAVLVATTANITLSGEQTIDGFLTSSSRVLVKNQSSPANNGIYVSNSGAWSRSTDMNTWAQVPGTVVAVEEGSVNADLGFICTAAPGGTLGTTPITFSPFGVYYADGTTLALTGNTFSIAPAGVSATQLATSAFDQATITGGAGTPASVAYAPYSLETEVNNLILDTGVNLSANTSYALYMNSDGFLDLADASNAVSSMAFWALGLATGPVSSGSAPSIVTAGPFSLGSADPLYNSLTVGGVVWLSTSGLITQTAPSTSGYADYKLGIAVTSNTILIDGKQLTGIN